MYNHIFEGRVTGIPSKKSIVPLKSNAVEQSRSVKQGKNLSAVSNFAQDVIHATLDHPNPPNRV